MTPYAGQDVRKIVHSLKKRIAELEAALRAIADEDYYVTCVGYTRSYGYGVAEGQRNAARVAAAALEGKT